MFRKKTIVILYETVKGIRGTFYASDRLFSYGTLFEKAWEKLNQMYVSDTVLVTNVIKL